MRLISKEICFSVFVFLLGYLLIYIAINNILNAALISGEGDIKFYYNSYVSFLRLRDAQILHYSEPTFKIVLYFLTLFNNEKATLHLISLIILFLSYLVSNIFQINLFSLLIFFASFNLPFNNSTKFLLTTWRTTFSLIFALLFIDNLFTNKKFYSIKNICLLFLSMISHNTSIILSLFFTIYYYLNSTFINFIRSLKINKSTIFVFGTLIFFGLIIIVTPQTSDYISSNIQQYLIEGNEYYDKAFVELNRTLIKFFFLVFLQFIISYFYRFDRKAFYFSKFILFVYLLSIIIAIFLSPIVADRIVNSFYWVTMLNLFNLTFLLLKNLFTKYFIKKLN